MKDDLYGNYLMHHGREGQKWGVRNGPPYPLSQKFANSIKGYKEHQKRKRRVKILNDPKKLYKHRSEFTEDEIRDATSKAQAVSELKKYIPQSSRKQKEIAKKKMMLVDNPKKFVKNQKFLTKDEQDQAMDYLYKQDKAKGYKHNETTRNIETAQGVTRTVSGAGRTVQDMVRTADKVFQLNPNYINMEDRSRANLLEFLSKKGDVGYKVAKGLGFDMGKPWDWERKQKETDAERDDREKHARDKRNRDYAEAENMVRGIMLSRGINPDRKDNRRYFQELMNIYLNQNGNGNGGNRGNRGKKGNRGNRGNRGRGGNHP